MLSPSPSPKVRPPHSVPPAREPYPTATAMLKIHSLLNPTFESKKYHSGVEEATPPPAPSDFTQGSIPDDGPRPQTSSTASPLKRQKLVKDAAIFVRSPFTGNVHYPPYECTEDSLCLNSQQRTELAHQHDRFQLFPSGHGDEGLICDYTRHIPYSSEKKSFLNKTGRDAFDVFQYTFTIPSDPEKRAHVVMWDYQIGLVRITPFFKACKYSKTTPAKALNSNAGLRELSHSITGGALAAQGYWMPYSCARAVCLTFCYHIRWALTPIFGPSFVKECLHPDHAGFARFKIDPEVVRNAILEAENSRPNTRSATPINRARGQEIPRSAPSLNVATRPLRSRNADLHFRIESPFDSGAETSGESNYTYSSPVLDSPPLSPKSKTPVMLSWTSINTSRSDETQEPRKKLGDSFSQSSTNVSWRPAESSIEEVPEISKPRASDARKRRRSSTPATTDTHAVNSDSASSPVACESDEVGDSSPSTSTSNQQPPVRITSRGHGIASSKRFKTERPVCKKFTAADARAARWLLNLSVRDSQLLQSLPQANAGNGPADHERT